MHTVSRIRVLSGAAGHLCGALDELTTTDYSNLADAVMVLIELIDAEICWLETGQPNSLRRPDFS